MALVIRSTPGLDKATGENDIRAMRNLTNKVWNAARFILMKHADSVISSAVERSSPASRDDIHNTLLDSSAPLLPSVAQNDDDAKHDIEFMKRLNHVIQNVTKQLDDYRIGLAAETVYNEFWHWFCDEAIEQSKRGEISRETLSHGLVVFLKLLHPFVPFVTEAVWEELRNVELRMTNDELLISSSWPIESPQRS